ncbi:MULTISPECIES: DUF6998 domain-containing protein [unclassified Mesorhizobium]|uniref:DUF6998 domain-containing protein n=1 Tax=unclassified Mesorhizobium TaxID=325217 RepID=UPI0030152E09
MSIYSLPVEVRPLIHARNDLRRRYGQTGLRFTLDGNLVGDLGEAIAAELFDLAIVERRGLKGVDARTKDGRTVQIKATGRGDSFVFTHSDERADWLIALWLRYEQEQVEVVYNGPYGPAIEHLTEPWTGQQPVRLRRLRALDAHVDQVLRLKATQTPVAAV